MLKQVLFQQVGRPPRDLTEPDWPKMAVEMKRKGVPFTDDKAGFGGADFIMARGSALETGVFGFDNRNIPEFRMLRHPHHTLMNNPG
jgi:hypothetical protein